MASELNSVESLEVLSFFPSYEGKIVLELRGSSGRFTEELAKKASKVISLDSKESINGYHESESVDLIFSSWLLMHLSDKEVEDIAKKLLKWVKVRGYICFIEPCSHQSRDHKQISNPEYRERRFYTTVFKECRISDISGKCFEFSLVGSECIGANQQNKKEQNQICWIWQKVSSEDDKEFDVGI